MSVTPQKALVLGHSAVLPPLHRRLAEQYFSYCANGRHLSKGGQAIIRWLMEFNRVYHAQLRPEDFDAIRKTKLFRQYMLALRVSPSQAALARLDGEANEAVDDYLEARRQAREKKDHKALHVAAADHLDRIGATRRKEQPTVAAVQITLKSKNYDAESLLAEAPTIEAGE